MEQFRTEITITPRPLIDHRTRIVTAGSCFSDNIGQKLSQSKFVVTPNPLGVCYNPISIHKGLTMKEVDGNLFVESQGTWRHFDFHSKFADVDKEGLSGKVSDGLVDVDGFDVALITYGTSWVYRLRSNHEIVSNCHKRPSSEFEKSILSVSEVVESFETFRKGFKGKIILTLSPVRHLKDTLELNSVGKSVLRLAIHEIVKKYPDVEYFPAYEIMMDDLRDYRFYDSDMLHPSEVAIDYIWKKFGERYFSEETQEVDFKWMKLWRSINHRSFQPSTEQHQKFLKRTLDDLEGLNKRLDVSAEIATIRKLLVSV